MDLDRFNATGRVHATTAPRIPDVEEVSQDTPHPSIRYTALRYDAAMAIQSFANPAVERFFREGIRLKGVGWVNVAKVVARKLDMLDYAAVLTDLASPPGNRPEALKGNLKGFHSIRINDQWRICFIWREDGAHEVEIVDYH